jgi:GNAT superfamily N-acetyltransferase
MTPDIRRLGLAEVEQLVFWAKAEGWNPGLDDAAAFHAADPGGFLGRFVDGDMVSGISAVAAGNDFGFIGLYITRPDRRGLGYGRAVWDAGMAYLGDRTIGLDGVPEQQANYRSMGFDAAYRTIRYSGTLPPIDAPLPATSLTIQHLPDVIAFDPRFYPAPRQAFLTRWISPPRIAQAVFSHGILKGYGVLRHCHEGCKIGPLFADDPAIAERLFVSLAAEADGNTIHIDVPESSRRFSDFLSEHGFEQGFTTARMYRGPAPDIRLNGVFGVTTLELG